MSILNLGMLLGQGCPCGVKNQKIGWFNVEPKNILFVYKYMIIYAYTYTYEWQCFLAPSLKENVEPHVLTAAKSWSC